MTVFSQITDDIIRKKQSGLLSLTPKNGKYQVKVFFSEGEVYYLTYGDLKDADCLAECEKLQLSDCFFAAGVKVSTSEKCSLPTAAVIERLSRCMGGGAGGERNLPVLQDRLKKAFVRQVGPVGEIVFADVLGQWRPSSPPTKQQLADLVNLIKTRIEDEKSAKEFLAEANTIIS